MKMHHMQTLARIVTLVGSLGLVVGCGGKPCDPIPPSAAAKSLGFIFAGGSLCKEDRMVATVEYPKDQADTIGALYKTSLTKAGWKLDSPSEGVFLATRANSTLFVMTAKSSQQSDFPFAMVRYCQDESCRTSLTKMSNAMKEMGKKL